MSDDKKQVFDTGALADALDELGQIAHEAGRVIDVAVYGGSCLMLVSNFRIATADVDAVAATDQGFLDSAAQTIAARRGWPRDWLNDGVRSYLSPAVEGFAQHTQATGQKEKSDIVESGARFYPEARTSGRLMLSVDHLWNEYSRRLQRPAHEPPQYLGRSGPES